MPRCGASIAAIAANRKARGFAKNPAAQASLAHSHAGADDDPDIDEEIARKRTRLDKIRRELDANGDGNITREELRAWKADLGAVKWLPYRKEVKKFYHRPSTQIVISILIVSNFIVACVQREIDPYTKEHQRHRALWETVDDIFTSCFIVELAINMYGSWMIPFFSSGWNYLDLVVVILGIFSLTRTQSVSQFTFVRVIRTFRVVRLFKRLQSLNSIINALIKSIPGVASAFLIMLIVMSIYAIISVDLFRDFGHSGEYTTSQLYGAADAQYGLSCGVHAIDCTSGAKLDAFRNSTAVSSVSARGVYYGQEYYGSFSRALYTQLQILTGESWSEAVVRPLLFGAETPGDGVTVAVLFVTYIIITQVILQNVVVAVLIEKFTDGKQSEDEEVLTRDLQMLERLAIGEDPSVRVGVGAKELDTRVDTNINGIFENIGSASSTRQAATTSLPTWAAAAGKDATAAAMVAHEKAAASAAQVSAGEQGTPSGNQPPVPHDASQAFEMILRELAALRAEQQIMAMQLRNIQAAVVQDTALLTV